MAAKSLRDAWLTTLTLNENVYPKHETVLKVEGELRDFFAHQIMIAFKNNPISEDILIKFFNQIFSSIPASKGE